MSNFPDVLANRFRNFKSQQFTRNAKHYQQLAEHGQQPEVMLVSCCDSRVDPETIFSAVPGELFVVRNVANLVPPYETDGNYHGISAALEYAALNLEIKHIVIMGHAGCGGIKAAIRQTEAQQTEARFISKWMSMLSQAKLDVLAAHQVADMNKISEVLEHAAIKTSLTNLRTFPFIQEMEKDGRLELHGCHFMIATGDLSVLNQSTGKFENL